MTCLLSVIALLALLADSASGHNWLMSPSRASTTINVANLIAPALPKLFDEPHVVVRAGQKFQVEWATGHHTTSTVNPSNVYLILQSKANDARLNQNQPELLDSVLADATLCPQTPPPAEYTQYHYKFNDTSLNFVQEPDKNRNPRPTFTRFYSRRVLRGDANFIPRPAVFAKIMRNMTRDTSAADRVNLVHQFAYFDANITSARRCVPSVRARVAPWIIALHRYPIVWHQPTEPDVAWVEFPAGTPPGDYIVHYRWRSYYDVMDVTVVAATSDIQNPFGSVPAAGEAPVVRFSRVDHCAFNAPNVTGKCVPMTFTAGRNLGLPEDCMAECKTSRNCSGVAVVPLTNPSTVADQFADLINIFTCAKPAPALNATHLCFPVVQRRQTLTSMPLYTTTDVEDPGFYSTCFLKQNAYKRDGLKDPAARLAVTNEVPEWLLSGRCITCADRDKFSSPDRTPVWAVARSCVDCDNKE
jgi:hypothetical protein